MSPLRILSVLALSLLLGAARPATSATRTAERALAARLLAFGRNDAATASAAPAPDTVAAWRENYRGELRRNAALREHVARAAWLDAFGRAPGDAELRAEAALPLTYAERLSHHLVHLGADAGEYREVIRRAYALVVRREPYAEEFEYWRPRGALTFVALLACLEDWARRNQPGLTVTSGTPTVPTRSRRVTIVPLSPEIAAEVRTLLPCPGLERREASAATHVLAVSGENLRAAGGMHLMLVGSP